MTVAAATGLEQWYRRLLAWYPAEHRQIYGEEMLGVMLAGARPDQRYPGRREAVDVLASAIRARLGRAAAAVADRRWADAAAVLGVVASILLLARLAIPRGDRDRGA
jgi:hypothetical protein